MDIQRSGARERRQVKRTVVIAAAAIGALLLAVSAVSVARRPPGVDAALIWSAEARAGEFIHEVTAAGSLYAPEVRSVTNRSDGIVEAVHVLPGHAVGPDDLLLELSSVTLVDELQKAQSALAAAEAEELLRQAKAEEELLNLQVTVAGVEADLKDAEFQNEAQQRLLDVRATSELDVRRAATKVEQERRRYEAARAQLNHYPKMRAAQDASALAKLSQQRRDVARMREQVAELKVRAGFSGVVQNVEVQAGKRLAAGTEVARIVNADNLIARVGVSERDAALVQVGQPARLEMGRKTLNGQVTRVEPAVNQQRLVTVDIALEGEGHDGLRPDLSVTARIEISRVPDTLVLERPAALREDTKSVRLFRVNPDGDRARRVDVTIARTSPKQVEIASGLEAGDRVIIADMTDWMDEPLIRIR